MSWRAETPVAVCGRAAVAKALLQRVLRAPEGLCGVVAGDRVVVWGEPLPWVDGAVYLGVPLGAPALRVPTLKEMDVPAELLQRQVLEACEASDPPIAVFDDALVPLGPGRALHPDVLQQVLDQWP